MLPGGRPGGSLGPDFTDAVVERDDGVVFCGDIEIHVRESDWRAHGHHKDPRYNGVVLHVVAAESEGRPAIGATGASISLLALNWKVAKPGLTSDHQRDRALGADVGVSGLPASGSGSSSAGTEHPIFKRRWGLWGPWAWRGPGWSGFTHRRPGLHSTSKHSGPTRWSGSE
jgi:hypothetical protein